MAPGAGIVQRLRTGCLTCRKRKVKCDESKPSCAKCNRVQRVCYWSDEPQKNSRKYLHNFSSSTQPELDASSPNSQAVGQPPGWKFAIEFPNLDRKLTQYMDHFINFCCRFIAYPNDKEGNRFQEKLVPLASSSPALLHAIIALSAGHLSRHEPQHTPIAISHYRIALRALNSALSDLKAAKSDSSLGACLLLCVYEITHSNSSTWQRHLAGAKGLIIFRGGPKACDCLIRFFSLLDISGSLSTCTAPLLEGNYWMQEGCQASSADDMKRPWPYYDSHHAIVSAHHELMRYMARLSKISAESISVFEVNTGVFEEKVLSLHHDLMEWWAACPSDIRDLETDWRTLPRQSKLSVTETLRWEACSSTKSCMKGCIIYLYHILDPAGKKIRNEEVTDAIRFIIETAEKTPRGYGLEMRLYWGLFMAGIALFNDIVVEDIIRRWLKPDISTSLYHASRALELLEVLWKRQHRDNKKYDWRQIQNQMGIQVYDTISLHVCLKTLSLTVGLTIGPRTRASLDPNCGYDDREY